ncbi:MAG: protein kinase, partial [bacterium]|nr:protein kinase [bacterium]
MKQRWRQVQQLFDAARERPPAERRDFVQRTAGEDRALGEEVRSLLGAHDQAETFLEQPFCRLGPAGRQPEQLPASLPGVERYRLRRTLGHGGMGTVYLAERADRAYRGQVAVKVTRAELAGEDLARRFRRERQILARLEHPSIAKLLDGGTTEEGLPYLVMEYVEGEPIDRYCDRQGLGVEARL